MSSSIIRISLLLALAAGCGSSDEPRRLPYTTDQTTVIGGSGFGDGDPDAVASNGGVIIATPDGKACGELDGVELCTTECADDDAVDVLVDKNGKVVDVICYAAGGVAIEDFEGPVTDTGNNVVLVVDGNDDGVDVMGDVTLDGNNVVLYGAGPDTSVLGGDLTLAKNNAVVRGVRVQGDVTISLNNGSIVDCVIEGDLIITGNNVGIALCEVWGKVEISGNNTVLVQNAFATEPSLPGKIAICNDNVLFTDADDDGVVADDEITGDASCS